MTPIQMSAIDDVIAAASHSGALQTIRTEHTLLEQSGIPFMVRWVSSLAEKDSDRLAAAERRNPNFDPFLPPEPELTVALVGAGHVAVLNKYPVIARHLLIVTRHFEDQTAALTQTDFTALASIMDELGGIGFYNGGLEAGASQRHKHLQWIPDASDGVQLHRFTHRLRDDLPTMAATHHPALPWRHCFVRLPEVSQTDGDTATQLHHAFRLACEHTGLSPDSNPMPPYNMLTDGRWMLVLPRRREQHAGISVNALGFAGSLFVRRPEQIETVRQLGPLQLLAAVATDNPGLLG